MLIRLRVISHKLCIELRQHSQPPNPKGEWLCKSYKAGATDDQIYFLINCTLHTNDRKLLNIEKNICAHSTC